jgi:hypothetical protein
MCKDLILYLPGTLQDGLRDGGASCVGIVSVQDAAHEDWVAGILGIIHVRPGWMVSGAIAMGWRWTSRQSEGGSADRLIRPMQATDVASNTERKRATASVVVWLKDSWGELGVYLAGRQTVERARAEVDAEFCAAAKGLVVK